jgi:hypothetical protein
VIHFPLFRGVLLLSCLSEKKAPITEAATPKPKEMSPEEQKRIDTILTPELIGEMR